ncbi:hypothetical protein T484DRAFT_1961442 [Baffinella frigidus]|nr:hypothetical protein T484DRAFT_1961442 [Cryptophyta sp. CCMP2293]
MGGPGGVARLTKEVAKAAGVACLHISSSEVLVRGGPDQVQYAQDLIEAALNRALATSDDVSVGDV